MKNFLMTLGFVSINFLLLHAQSSLFSSYYGLPTRSEVALETKPDSKGNIIIVGYSSNLSPDTINYDYTQTDMLVAKIKPDGSIMWSRTIGVNNNFEDIFLALDITLEGDIIAVGTSERVPANFPYIGTHSKACIYKFDGNTGNILWDRHVSINNFNDVPNRRGDIYLDVKVLPNGNIVAVGEKDFSPSYSDGIITMFNSTNGNIIANKVYPIPSNSNGLWHLDFDENSIYITGNHQGNTFMDMNVMKLDYGLNTIWNTNYDISYNGNNSQHIRDIISLDTTILVLTNIDFSWGGSGAVYTALTTLKKVDGSILSNNVFLNSGATAQGTSALYVSPSFNHYLINNPTTAPYDLFFPSYGVPAPSLSIDAVINTNYAFPKINTIAGSQIINSISGNNDDIVLAGTSRNDPQQIGQYDIFIQKFHKIEDTIPNGMHCVLADTSIVSNNSEIYEYSPDTNLVDVSYAFIPLQLNIVDDLKMKYSCFENKLIIDSVKKDVTFTLNDVEIFPNPTTNNINMNIKNQSGKMLITIYNSQGEIKVKRIYQSDSQIEISVNNFPDGIYFIVLQNEINQVVRKAFIKE